MFDMLLKKFEEFQYPKSLAHDFEKGALNAIVAKFMEVVVFGCYFLFCPKLVETHAKKTFITKLYQ